MERGHSNNRADEIVNQDPIFDCRQGIFGRYGYLADESSLGQKFAASASSASKFMVTEIRALENISVGI